MASASSDSLVDKPPVKLDSLVHDTGAGTVVSCCRLCLKPASVSSAGIRLLIDACKCTKLRYAHLDCLICHVSAHSQVNCELCKAPFNVPAMVRQQAYTRATSSSGDVSEGSLVTGLTGPTREDLYFSISALIDRLTVLLLLWLFVAYVRSGSDWLTYYLVGYAAIYLLTKYFLGSVRVIELWEHFMTRRGAAQNSNAPDAVPANSSEDK